MVFKYLKRTVHGRTNFKALVPFLDVVDQHPDSSTHFTADGFMDLVMENLQYTFDGWPVYSLSHYGEQNGDLMADPDMTVCIDRESQTVEPLTFRNDYMGINHEIYTFADDGRMVYSKKLRTDLDKFLWQWLNNIANQGFTPSTFTAHDDPPDDELQLQDEAVFQNVPLTIITAESPDSPGVWETRTITASGDLLDTRTAFSMEAARANHAAAVDLYSRLNA